LAFVLQRSTRQLQLELRRVIDDLIHVEKLIDTFDKLSTRKNYHQGKEFIYKKGSVAIKNMYYNYEENDVFADFSLDIAGGKKTALVGSSGGGKSTLIKLIAGYFYAAQGKVCIDGQDLNKIQLKSYYKHIGYLTQDPSVFDGTIYENLSYALDYTPSDKELNDAIYNAGCEFIYAMDK